MMFIKRGLLRTAFAPSLNVCHMCPHVVRSSRGVGWNPVSGMMKINVMPMRITPTAPT